MDVKFDFKAHQLHKIDTLNILAYTILLIITVITIWKFKIGYRFRYTNEISLNIILSLIIGALIKYCTNQDAQYFHLKVVPSDLNSLRLDNLTDLPVIKQNQTTDLIISTNPRNLTKLIRNLATNNSSTNNASLERLNVDYPLTSSNNRSNAVSPAVKNEATSRPITEKQLTKSTLESTAQEAAPTTENNLDKKPTLPLNNKDSKQNNSLIKPTSSSNLIQTNKQPIQDKNNKKITAEEINLNQSFSEYKNTKTNQKSSNKDDDQKTIDKGRNETLLKLSAPPDSLFINLEIEDKSKNTSSAKNYIYLFKGELVNQQNLQTDLFISQRAQFDPEFFLNIVLPLIVFNAGYSLNRKFFFHNLGAIFTYSFFGTVISTFTVAVVVWSLTLLFPIADFTFIDSLYFGSIISSTDTVTILAFFNNIHVDANLYSLILGESLLSDAVVIVLVRSIDFFEQDMSTSLSADHNLILSIGTAGLNFFRIFILSVLVGFSVGILNAFLTKFTQIREFYLLESSLFVLMSYSAFLIAELLDLSGIVSILFVSICQAHYNYYNLSPQSQELLVKFTELLGFLAENFIFSYLGVSMFINPAHRWSISIIIFGFIAIIIGRLLNIYPLSFLLNLNRTNKIPAKYQHILFLSGLRGSMAYALSMQNTVTKARQIILSTTSIIVIVTTVIGGSLLSTTVDLLNIDQGVKESDQEMTPFSKNTNLKANPQGQSASNLNTSFTSIGRNQSCLINQQNLDDKAWLVRKWCMIDCKFMKPLLTNSNPSPVELFPNFLQSVARLFTTTEQLNNALNYNYTYSDTTTNGCGFNNVNYDNVNSLGFTDIEAAGDVDLEDNQKDPNSNYQRYSFEENYLTFGMNEDNQRDRINGQLNEALEKSVSQLVNTDNGQQIIFDRLSQNQAKTNK